MHFLPRIIHSRPQTLVSIMSPQKMVVIPLERYEKLKKKETDSPLQTKPPDQSEATPSVQKPPIIPPREDDVLSEEDVTDYMPKTLKHRCRLLLFHMKKNDIHWDALGRLLLNDECIENTHIVDLVRDVVSSYKRTCCSASSKVFARLLTQTHCPRSLLNPSLLQDEKVDEERKKET